MHKQAWVTRRDSIGHPVCRHGGGQSHGAAGQSFADAEDIGNYVGMFKGEHLTRATETGGDFIEYQQGVVLIAQLTQTLQVMGE